MSWTILMTAPVLGAGGVHALAEAGCEVHYLHRSQDVAEVEALMARIPFDAVISRTVMLSRTAIASCPTLKVICKHGVGVTNIDVEAATAFGIPVFTTPGTNAQSVAELTLGLMLNAARRISWLQQEIAEGRWTRTGSSMELSGKTLGLVGMGEIGQRVARVARAMGMRVRFYDPALHDPQAIFPDEQVTSLDALLAQSNVLSLHCPVNAATRQMLNSRTLALLPAGALVINTSRGELIDEASLDEALRSGHLFAAGLDTVATEPLPAGHPFRALDNLTLTPHIGGSTPEALDEVARYAARQCLDFLNGLAVNPLTCVNRAVLKEPS
ncbi:hydroxyacid dehydrogenase [Pantoea sp. Cy-640]|uniref:hydroxyacid dehydrogenase n=1 Tax=Pantoea sp. Cy-640 TaxID=2608353 RepID=UPI00141A339B|nr:hydroxyacid dehydrogenase [Pantoea sp. Cy-640]NIG16219.1 hydroxyacid dehydrogenase [Pantoea sp. Cy-640]